MSSESKTVHTEVPIPLSVPEIQGNESKYILECLQTGWVSSAGQYVDRFEQQMADYVGTRYAVATVNGTSALHIALLVAGVKPDDLVLVPTLTFIAPVNAIRYANAWPVFMDAEPDCWQMNVDLVADFLAHECVPSAQGLRHKASGRRVSGLLPVHILGHPVDLDPLAELAGKHGLFMIEDATESLGARYRGKNAGAIGHLACFSFNGNKVITTGGGGMITTNNAAFAAKARHLTTQAKADPVEYIHDEIGYNYRLTNIQAAMGCAQLERLEEFIAAKRRIARTYREAFAAVPGLEFMPQSNWAESTYWLSSVKIRADDFGLDSRTVMRKLGEHQIQSRPLWQPINLSPAYRELKAPPCPVAAALYREVLSLPSSVGLKASDQQRVIETMLALGSDAGRKRSHC